MAPPRLTLRPPPGTTPTPPPAGKPAPAITPAPAPAPASTTPAPATTTPATTPEPLPPVATVIDNSPVLIGTPQAGVGVQAQYFSDSKQPAIVNGVIQASVPISIRLSGMHRLKLEPLFLATFGESALATANAYVPSGFVDPGTNAPREADPTSTNTKGFGGGVRLTYEQSRKLPDTQRWHMRWDAGLLLSGVNYSGAKYWFNDATDFTTAHPQDYTSSFTAALTGGLSFDLLLMRRLMLTLGAQAALGVVTASSSYVDSQYIDPNTGGIVTHRTDVGGTGLDFSLTANVAFTIPTHPSTSRPTVSAPPPPTPRKPGEPPTVVVSELKAGPAPTDTAVADKAAREKLATDNPTVLNPDGTFVGVASTGLTAIAKELVDNRFTIELTKPDGTKFTPTPEEMVRGLQVATMAVPKATVGPTGVAFSKDPNEAIRQPVLAYKDGTGVYPLLNQQTGQALRPQDIVDELGKKKTFDAMTSARSQLAKVSSATSGMKFKVNHPNDGEAGAAKTKADGLRTSIASKPDDAAKTNTLIAAEIELAAFYANGTIMARDTKAFDAMTQGRDGVEKLIGDVAKQYLDKYNAENPTARATMADVTFDNVEIGFISISSAPGKTAGNTGLAANRAAVAANFIGLDGKIKTWSIGVGESLELYRYALEQRIADLATTVSDKAILEKISANFDTIVVDKGGDKGLEIEGRVLTGLFPGGTAATATKLNGKAQKAKELLMETTQATFVVFFGKQPSAGTSSADLVKLLKKTDAEIGVNIKGKPFKIVMNGIKFDKLLQQGSVLPPLPALVISSEKKVDETNIIGSVETYTDLMMENAKVFDTLSGEQFADKNRYSVDYLEKLVRSVAPAIADIKVIDERLKALEERITNTKATDAFDTAKAFDGKTGKEALLARIAKARAEARRIDSFKVYDVAALVKLVKDKDAARGATLDGEVTKIKGAAQQKIDEAARKSAPPAPPPPPPPPRPRPAAGAAPATPGPAPAPKRKFELKK